MTLPTTNILPIHSEKIQQGGKDLDTYMKELIATLQRQYESVAQAINGSTRRDVDFGSVQWIPTVSGSTSAGTGAYTYQTGTVLRAGLMVDVWFDIRWSSHTGTGTLTLDLPYLCAQSANAPFVGVVSAENITFSGYLTASASPDSRNLLIQDNISGAGTSGIAVPNADTTIRGYARYIGQSIERS